MTGDVLGAQRKTLYMKHTIDLCFSMWLEANLWIQWNLTTVFNKHMEFTWWDQCPDQLGTMEMVTELLLRILNKPGIFKKNSQYTECVWYVQNQLRMCF